VLEKRELAMRSLVMHSFLALSSRVLLAAGLVALAAMCTGCGAIGLGLGAATPRYVTSEEETVIVSTSGAASSPNAGEYVRVWDHRASAGPDVAEGRYGGVRDGVSTEAGQRAIPLDEVQEISLRRQARVRRGTYWAKGLAIGVAIDSTLTLAALIFVGAIKSGGHSDHGPLR
jgi:hypothetical protein